MASIDPRSNEPTSEVEKIKAKFRERAQEYDREEEALRSQIALLQRMLVRVSLAADGQSSDLDDDLSQLREYLTRDRLSVEDLDLWRKRLEESVLRFDESTATNANELLETVEELVVSLQKYDLPPDKRKELKGFAKQIRDKQQALKEAPNLLAQFAAFQQQAFEDQLSRLDAMKESPGLLKKLFGNRSDDQPKGVTDGAEKAETIDPERVYSSSPNEAYSESETELDGEHEEKTEVEQIAGHVNSALRNLLEQISLPNDAEKKLSQVITRISEPPSGATLCQSVDDVVELVLKALCKGQQDFENFLISLEARLQAFQKFLGDALSLETDRKGAERQLNKIIQKQIGSLTEEVQKADNLKVLKESVNVSLDNIMSALTGFMQEEDGREQTLRRELEEARARLQEIEEEASVVKEKLQEERARALRDALTKLPNREAYNERLSLEFSRWERYRRPIALAVADIDYFKRINDSYGHTAGDRVIKLMAKELRARVRETDFIARIGGEEFIILMPETELEIARQVLDKTRDRIANLPFHFRDTPIQITMSFGVAAFEGFESSAMIFDAADEALYAAKKGGRNRVEVASAP